MRNINDLRRDLRAKTCSVIRFRDDEYVWFAHKAPRDNGESAFIQGDTPLRVRDLDKPVCGEYSPSFGELLVMDPFAELGTYYAVNPFKSDTSRTAENVSRFLY